MTEKELIKGCIKGNKDAQYMLYKQYAANMLGTCYRYAHSIDDAEDILQEGFIKVFAKINQFKGEGNLGGWIRRVMVNTAINYIKKHKRYKQDLQPEENALHIVSKDDIEVNLNVKDIVKTIKQLPVNYQIVFNLIAIEGYEYQEVCSILNMNINTTRSMYSRARMMLIQLLKKNEIDLTKYNEQQIGK